MSQQPITSGPSHSARPGQMTAVMRAMPQFSGPKVLRIGLVQGGKVIEERVIKQRTHVTIGPSEKSMFVVPNQNVPPNFRLFELVGNDYHLNFLDGMSGRVALQTGISDLAALRGQAKKNQQGAYQIRLTEDARGKVVVGESTFLFQFVAPPPVAPKPQLPVSVKSGLASQIDWTTTIIAAFSFLFHFGLVGAIYSDWMDPVVDDENVAGLIDSVKSLPPPPPVETPEEKPSQEATQEKTPAPAETPKPQGGAKPTKPGQMSQSERAALSAQLEQLEMATLGALNSAGPATAGVLKNGDVPTGALDMAAASNAGVSAAGANGLNMGAGGGPLRPGMTGAGLAGLGSTHAGTPGGAGNAAVVQGPKGNADIGKADVAGGSVSNADRVVAGLKAGFRACYNKGLANNPDLQGSVKIVAKIGPNGEVMTATPSGGSSLGDDVVECVVRRVKGASFSPPDGGGATIVIPVTFALQK